MGELENLENFDWATLVAGLAGIAVLLVIMGLVWYVLQIIAYWKIFKKAGEPGWKSIIPFYNLYVQYRLTWSARFFWGILAIVLVGGVLTAIGGTVPMALASVCSLASLVLDIMSLHYLSKVSATGAVLQWGYFSWNRFLC